MKITTYVESYQKFKESNSTATTNYLNQSLSEKPLAASPFIDWNKPTPEYTVELPLSHQLRLAYPLMTLVPEIIHTCNQKNYKPRMKLGFATIPNLSGITATERNQIYVDNFKKLLNAFDNNKDHNDALQLEIVYTKLVRGNNATTIPFPEIIERMGNMPNWVVIDAEVIINKTLTSYTQDYFYALLKHKTESKLMLISAFPTELTITCLLHMLPVLFKTHAKELYDKYELNYYNDFIQCIQASNLNNRITNDLELKWLLQAKHSGNLAHLLKPVIGVDAQIKNLVKSISDSYQIKISYVQETIRDTEYTLKSAYEHLHTLQAEKTFNLDTKLEMYRDAITFLERAKPIVNYEFALAGPNTYLFLEILTKLNIFEIKYAEKLLRNKLIEEFALGEYTNPKILEKTFELIFITQQYSILIKQPIVLDLTNKTIKKQPVWTTDESMPAFEVQSAKTDLNRHWDKFITLNNTRNKYEGVLNPHIQGYDCFGSAIHEIRIALHEQDLVKAVNIAIHCASNMNLVDDVVTNNELLEFLQGNPTSHMTNMDEKTYNKAIVNNSTQERYTIKQFIQQIVTPAVLIDKEIAKDKTKEEEILWES